MIPGHVFLLKRRSELLLIPSVCGFGGTNVLNRITHASLLITSDPAYSARNKHACSQHVRYVFILHPFQPFGSNIRIDAKRNVIEYHLTKVSMLRDRATVSAFPDEPGISDIWYDGPHNLFHTGFLRAFAD